MTFYFLLMMGVNKHLKGFASEKNILSKNLNLYFQFPEVCDSGANCRQLNCKMTDSCSMINLR